MIQHHFQTMFQPFPQPTREAPRARIGMVGLGITVAVLGLLNLAASAG